MSRELDNIVTEYNRAQNGAAKIALAKRGYKLADEENDVYFSLWFRSMYITQHAIYGDSLQIYLVFPELLKLYDRYEDTNVRVRNHIDVVWYYKWVIQCSVTYYQVSRKQFEVFVDDYEKRLKSLGYSRRALCLYKALFYIKIEPDKAEEYFEEHLKLERDIYSDCEACERCDEMKYLIAAGRFDEAIEIGRAIFERKLTCDEQPYESYGVVLSECCNRILGGDFSMLEKGIDSIDHVKQGLKKGLIANRAADIIMFYALTDESAKALPFVKKYGIIINNAHVPRDKFEFAIAMARLFRSIGKSKYKMKLAVEHPLYREDGIYNCDEICRHYIDEARLLAQHFDERNGTSKYKERLLVVTAE